MDGVDSRRSRLARRLCDHQVGYHLYPRSKSVMDSCPTFLIASMLWLVSRIASFRELLAQGLNEAHALIESMVTAEINTKSVAPTAVKAVLAIQLTEEGRTTAGKSAGC